MAYNGPRTFANGRFEAMIQVCGIVPKCLNCTTLHEKINPNFDYFDIIGNFNKPSSVMPVGLNNELYPILNFQYEKINSTFVILSMETSFFYFALFCSVKVRINSKPCENSLADFCTSESLTIFF